MGYTHNPNQNIKIRFVNVLNAISASKVLGKNEVRPVTNLDMVVTQDQLELLKSHYVRFEILEELTS